jgi:hypothetical protein
VTGNRAPKIVAKKKKKKKEIRRSPTENDPVLLPTPRPIVSMILKKCL